MKMEGSRTRMGVSECGEWGKRGMKDEKGKGRGGVCGYL